MPLGVNMTSAFTSPAAPSAPAVRAQGIGYGRLAPVCAAFEIEEVRRAGSEALNVLASPVLYTRRLDIFERTAALRLPAIYQSPEFAEEGGLIGYGPRLTQMFRQLARQLAKVLGGENVSKVPIEQPTTFELAINLQAAKAIGFEVPSSLVLRADKVIE
jgi:putative ABC transport system substrate-binding protein